MMRSSYGGGIADYLEGNIITHANPVKCVIIAEHPVSKDVFKLDIRVGYWLFRNEDLIVKMCCGSNIRVKDWGGVVGMNAGEFWRDRTFQEHWEMEKCDG